MKCEDECDAPLVRGADGPDSFAHRTITERLPVILTTALNDLTTLRTREEIDAEDCTNVVSALSELKYEVWTNKPLCLLKEESHKGTKEGGEFQFWQKEIESEIEKYYEGQCNYHNVSMLFAECYMYRRLKNAFNLSKSLKDYDPFEIQKRASFTNMLPAIEKLCSYMEKSVHASENLLNYILISLWGNKCDLSLNCDQDQTNVKDNEGHPANSRKSFSEQSSHKIIRDDCSQLVSNLTSLQNKVKRDRSEEMENEVYIDIVLDNAGFELLGDLCLAVFLIENKFCHFVRLRCKYQYWFVSDVTEKDFSWLIEQLVNGTTVEMREFGSHIHTLLGTGKLALVTDYFWTYPNSYEEMSTKDPALYKELSDSSLLIFKGDLNFRKLIGERSWAPTTPFKVALQGFEPAPLCALRTNKAEVICGLDQSVVDELNSQEEIKNEWQVNGEYAVVMVHVP
eukprot:Nk52_evm36s967 gene=Nk52_evmTU36s967